MRSGKAKARRIQQKIRALDAIITDAEREKYMLLFMFAEIDAMKRSKAKS
jgi:hypothetical protein